MIYESVAHLFNLWQIVCCPIMCLNVLTSVLWCPLRFPHKHDFLFVLSTWVHHRFLVWSVLLIPFAFCVVCFLFCLSSVCVVCILSCHSLWIVHSSFDRIKTNRNIFENNSKLIHLTHIYMTTYSSGLVQTFQLINKEIKVFLIGFDTVKK
jgi:hypothetical protein